MDDGARFAIVRLETDFQNYVTQLFLDKFLEAPLAWINA